MRKNMLYPLLLIVLMSSGSCIDQGGSEDFVFGVSDPNDCPTNSTPVYGLRYDEERGCVPYEPPARQLLGCVKNRTIVQDAHGCYVAPSNEIFVMGHLEPALERLWGTCEERIPGFIWRYCSRIQQDLPEDEQP